MAGLIWIRGAGDLATGVAIRLLRAGFDVIHGEIRQPTAIRRTVSFSEAVYEGQWSVEGFLAKHCEGLEAINACLASGLVPVYTGDEAAAIAYFAPEAFIEATLRKRQVEVPKLERGLTIGLGPGFAAGSANGVTAVVETNRGHDLGRVLWSGEAEPDTGVPGLIGGYGAERVVRAPCEGLLTDTVAIGTVVVCGEIIGAVSGKPVLATIDGLLRGMLRADQWVHEGMKIADIDPRGEKAQCLTVSDKARAIGGGVLEAIMAHGCGRNNR